MRGGLLLCVVMVASQDVPIIPPGTVVPTSAPTVAENETLVESNETVVEDKPQVAFPDIMGESVPPVYGRWSATLTLLLRAVHEDITPMIKATRRGFENASCETYSIFADPLALTGDWAVPLYVIGMAYMLLGIAIVCDEYFVHAIQVRGAEVFGFL